MRTRTGTDTTQGQGLRLALRGQGLRLTLYKATGVYTIQGLGLTQYKDKDWDSHYENKDWN